MKHNILVTGSPGSGKTTLIRRLAEMLRPMNPKGFYSEETRDHEGRRTGFDLVDICTGSRAALARKGSPGPKVGSYGVDIEALDGFLEAVDLNGAGLVVVDEIGKMECLSSTFRRFVEEALDSDIPVLASISLKGGGLIKEVKQRDDAILFTLSSANREHLGAEILGKAFKD